MRKQLLAISLAAAGITLPAATIQVAASKQLFTQEQVIVMKAVPALYPTLAAIAGESGEVIIEVKIKPDGTVAEATAVEEHKLFKVAAENSASKWLFNSVAEHDGFRIARLTFSFRLLSKTADAETLLPVFMPPYKVEIRGTTPTYSYSKDVDPPMKTKPKQKAKRTGRGRAPN